MKYLFNKTQVISNGRFVELLLESIGEGVFTLDAEGCISSWNPSMERIAGYAAEEIIGEKCRKLCFSQCFGNQCPADLNECGIYQYGKIEPTECFLKHKDGYDVPIIKSARVIREKDGSVIGVVEAVTDLTELQKARLKMEEATRRLAELYRFDKIIGKSHAMQQIFSSIRAAAASEATTVLIQGESGTGKELVAGAIHYNSERKGKPLVTVNCSALSESLLESELFGHIKGAFTGALRDRTGRFEDAADGSIFLDEIGEISPMIQLKLLRVIQEREIERVGESKKRKINIRIIAATNRDLYKLVKEGRFRDDLYYRLKVFPIYLPPLRKRREDIPLLVNHFVDLHSQKTGKKISGVSPSAMRIVMDYEWPGNVREMENAIEHAFVLCNQDQIDVFDLPVEIRQFDYRSSSSELREHNSLRGLELTRDILVNMLIDCFWNKAEVGRRVGLSRAAIWKYMKKWDIPMKRP